mgnify:CR=1 FL=1
MKKLIVLIFSLLLLESCTSEKKLLTEKTKFNWDISYVQSGDFTDTLNSYSFTENDIIVKSKLNVENQEPKENKLFASSEKIIKSHLLNNLETDLEKINKSLYKDLLVNNKKYVSDEIEKSDNKDRDGFIVNLIGVSFLVLITGLDVFLALLSIAFDGFYGVSLIFFFSSLILTYLSINAVKKLNEKYPKKKSKSENNQSSKKLIKTVLKTLGLIIGSLIITAIIFNEIIF